MDERAGSTVRVGYLGPTGVRERDTLPVASESFRVEQLADVSRLRERLPALDCVVVAHGPTGSDWVEVLDAVEAAAVDRPVVVVGDPAVATEALAAGATEVLSGDPTDPPAALLTHRIEQAVGGSDRDGSTAFTRSVLNTISDVAYVLDPDGSFRQWNRELIDLTAYDEEALTGAVLSDLVVREDQERLADAVESAAAEGMTETREAALLTAVGDRVTYEFNVTPLTDDDGTVGGLAGTAREVTERKLREQRLTVLTRVLRHNVRNRMTVVQGRTEQLESTVGADPNLDAIEQAASELVALSDKARRVEAALRESSANRRALDVVDVAETTVAALAREFPRADLAVQAPEELRARTTDGLTFAIEELVRNGIDHNDSDPPTVRVTIQREPGDGADHSDDAGPEMVSITVVDDGPGIPETERVALTTGRETDLEHATGLGLWLVNWVVTAAGGELVCDSCDEMGGAKITLRFPAAGR
jgi:PAS domain S-box-containing protein